MTTQLLPDDILALILEEYLTASAGYTDAERFQVIKSVSLSSRTLALACRRLIFQRTKIAIGGPPTHSDTTIRSSAEGLKDLFQVNPSYFSFVNSLRVESSLVCRLVVGALAPSENASNSDVGDHSLDEQKEDSTNTVTIRYASTTAEEAAVCWLLSQTFPNLKSFHFIVDLPNSGDQTALQRAAFAGTLPSLTLTAEAALPKAILRFLSTGNESLDHLTFSSNLPPPILRYFNGTKPLKSLTLTKFSDVKPVNRTQTEIPFFLGVDDNAGRPPFPGVRNVQVENLSCDMSGGNLLHWLYGPHLVVDMAALKTLHLKPANEGRGFPFVQCSASLTDLDVVYSNHATPPASLGALATLRRLTLRVEAEWSLEQLSFTLNTIQSQSVEDLEIALRLTHVMDFKVIRLLTSLDRRLFARKHEWKNLKTLRIVGYMSDGEWEKVEARKGFGGFKDCLRSVFGPLSKSSVPADFVLGVSIVKEHEYLHERQTCAKW